MKRFLSIFVAIVMAMTMVVPAFAYTDTKDSDYNAAITFLSGLGIVNGYDDGSYQPEKVVTRAEMAKLLVVALGLEAGASLLEGTSSFDDVPTSHWATGYIAVAVQYGLIKGDGDGNFRPDDTVNYAEVATMVLRALGYDRVVDKNGTWPTNYLNKANELKIFDEIANKFEGTDGATRGTVAQMLWNMLNTQMWVVITENESDGLNYGKDPEGKMIDTKFPEYSFSDELKFKDVEVTDEKEEWVVTLVFEGETEEADDIKVEYAGNDFYTFVPGTEYEALIYKAKKADPVIVSMFATDDNVLVEGNAIDLDEDYTNYTATPGATYAYLLLSADKKAATVNGVTEINGVANSGVVTDVEVTKTATKIYVDGTVVYNVKDEGKEYDYPLIIKDGERATVLELEIGDVLTTVDETAGVIVVSNDVIEGTYEGYSEETTQDGTQAILEVDGDELDVRTFIAALEGLVYATDDTRVYVVEDEEEVALEKSEVQDNVLYGEVKDNEYLDQTATFYFNVYGDLVKVVFGEVAEIESTGSFYLVTTGKIWAVADSEGSVEYIQLANEDGVASYVISEDLSSEEYALLNEQYGTIVWVEFDKNDEIDTVVLVEDAATLPSEEDADYVIADATGTLNEDTAYIQIGEDEGVKSIKITSSTVVFTYTEILDEDNEGTDKFELEISKGIEALKGVDAENIMLALESADSVRAEYAFVFGDPVSSDKHFGIVDSYSAKAGVNYVTISGVKYELADASEEANAKDFVVFTVNDDEAKIEFVYAGSEVVDANKVTKVDAEIITLGDIILDKDLLGTDQEAIKAGEASIANSEDYRYFVIEVEYDAEDAPYFGDFEEVTVDEVKFAKNQGVEFELVEDVMVILNGIDWPDPLEEDEGEGEGEEA